MIGRDADPELRSGALRRPVVKRERILRGNSALAAIACAAFAGMLWAQAAEQPRANSVTIRGKAVATTGDPVPNVKVTIYDYRAGQPQAIGTSATGADGAFRIEFPDTQMHVLSLKVEAPEGPLAPAAMLPAQGLQTAAGLPPPEVTLLFAPATGRLTGTVRDEDGKPVSGAAVTLGPGQTLSAWFERTAKTDEKGLYEIARLAPGQYRVSSVSPPQGTAFIRLVTWKWSGLASASLNDGQTITQDFRLTRGASLTGRVLDENGKPIAGVNVSCSVDAASEIGPPSQYQVSGQSYGAQGTSDADGRYALLGLTQETYRVDFAPPEGMGLAPTALRDVNAPQATAVTLQDVRLYRAGQLAAEVVDAAGKPIDGATASMVISTGRRMAATISAKADAAGRFLLGGLASGAYDVSIGPPEGSASYQKTFAGVAIVGGFTVERRFALPTGLRISGKVTGPDGRPVPRAEITAQTGFPQVNKAVADDQGAYTISGIPPEPPAVPRGVEPALWVSPPHQFPALLPRKALINKAQPGATAEAKTLDVQLQPGAAISGRVTGPDGAAVVGCHVLASQRLPRAGVTTQGQDRTGTDGGYLIAHLTPGAWSVVVRPPAETKLLAKTVAERAFDGGKVESVDVPLERGGAVAGRALADGKPVAGVLTLFKGANAAGTTVAGPDGAFRFDAVALGTYTVVCNPLDPVLVETLADVEVRGTAESRMDIPVLHTGSLSATILGDDGKPLPQGSFSILGSPPGSGRVDPDRPPTRVASFSGAPDKDGKLRLENIAPRKYQLWLNLSAQAKTAGYAAPEKMELVIEPGKETPLNIVVTRTPAK